MTWLWLLLLWLLVVAAILRWDHVINERGKEADRIFNNYVNRKKGRHVPY